MPRGPRGERFPIDVIGAAVKITRIATGEETEGLDAPEPGKDPAAAAMGWKGGPARARNLTPEQQAEIARKAVAKRWTKPPA